MRRLALAAMPLILAAGILWLAGRAPTRFVLAEECARFQAERISRLADLEMRGARLETAILKGVEPSPELERLRGEVAGLHRAHKRLSLRGWEVVLIPDGADRPEPADFLVAGRFDPRAPTDPPTLRREMEVWIAPRGGLARMLSGLGLSP